MGDKIEDSSTVLCKITDHTNVFCFGTEMKMGLGPLTPMGLAAEFLAQPGLTRAFLILGPK